MKITENKEHKVSAPSQGKDPTNGKTQKKLFLYNQITMRYPRPMTIKKTPTLNIPSQALFPNRKSINRKRPTTCTVSLTNIQ